MEALIWLPIILLLSVLGGQLFRIDLFSSSAGGVLVSDITVGIVVLAYLGSLIAKRTTFQWTAVGKAYFLWVAYLVLDYIIAQFGYGGEAKLVGFAYLIRLLSYSSILIIFEQVATEKMQQAVVRGLLYLTGGLLILGVMIRFLLPDFGVLASLGWDPHVARFTSSWLDPNYFGSFAAMLFAVFLAFIEDVFQNRNKWVRIGYGVLLPLLWLAIYATYSRSALVTFVAAGFAVAIFRGWRAIVIVLLGTVLFVAIPSRLQERVSQSVSFVSEAGSAQANSTDPTANARVESWKRAITIFKERPLLGVGYNFYSYASVQVGANSAETASSNRSSAGSDSSVLTLLATTGIVGISLFLALVVILSREFFRHRYQALSLASIGVLVGLAVSSIFNNTLLYAHILLPSVIVMGTALGSIRRLQEPKP